MNSSYKSNGAMGATRAFVDVPLPNTMPRPAPPNESTARREVSRSKYPAPPPSTKTKTRRPASARSHRPDEGVHRIKAAMNKVDRVVAKEVEEEKISRLHKGLPVTKLTQHGATVIARKASASLAKQLQESEYLVFHWRHASRELQREVDRLRQGVVDVQHKSAEKERVLLERLQQVERQTARATVIATRVEEDASPLRAVIANLEAQLAHERAEHEQEATELREDHHHQEQKAKEQKHLRNEMQMELDEMRKIYHEHDKHMIEVKVQTEKAKADQESAAHQVQMAERIRDELLDKLEAERGTVRMLCQQLDLIAETYTNYNENEKIFNKVVYSTGSESNKVKEVESLRRLINKHTRDKGWQNRKQTILDLIRKKQMGSAANMHMDMMKPQFKAGASYGMPAPHPNTAPHPSTNVALQRQGNAKRQTKWQISKSGSNPV